jgi:predicted nucleic acid-binding Zn ribbon protein
MLDAVLDSHGVRDQVERLRALEVWPEVVGEALAEVARAVAVDESALIVEVRTSAWLMELNMMKGDLLARVNTRVEVPLGRIVFVLAETR